MWGDRIHSVRRVSMPEGLDFLGFWETHNIAKANVLKKFGDAFVVISA